MLNLGTIYWDEAVTQSSFGLPNIPLTLAAAGIWAVGVGVTAFTAFLLVLAKLSLAALLALGPIFILLSLFESTRKFLDAWLGQACNFVLLIVLTAAVVKLILSILQSYVAQAETAAMLSPSLPQAIGMIALTLIGSLVLRQVPSVASALGGGIAISTLGAIGWGYHKILGTGSALRPTSIRREFRRATLDAALASEAIAVTGRKLALPVTATRRFIEGRNRISKAA
jgi:type IV secretion system protein VirB6